MKHDIFVVIEHLQGQVLEISYVMLAAAHKLAEKTGGEVIAILLGHDGRALADDLATDRVIYLDHPALAEFTPDAYLAALVALVTAERPRAVLLGHTSIGMDVASGLSARLALPLVSQCKSVASSNGSLQFTSQICGGKIMAEGDFPEGTLLLTMLPGGFKPEDGRSSERPELMMADPPPLEDLRVSLLQYIEPEAGDVDISEEPILIAVGRGMQNEDNLELVQELADALDGEICASRPIVDLGWLPTSRMVGKSGRSVKPKLYLALGISGAPEHIEGITDSDLLIAVNSDPAAPIFDIAQFGAEIDMFDLVESLVEQIEEAKGG
ncbi:MAG: electron transfer flavoprotein subunit alpha/FixB family protein [Chloroflexi bacterium]|nr:electron transfer flavoprotein subunit alpha/FixB family protein [Chloroflexota bacterium]